MRRLCIRHCHKALLASIVAAALWCPSVAGGVLLLAASHAVATRSGPPSPASGGGAPRLILNGGMCTAVACLSVAWVCLQYAVCNVKVQEAIAAHGPDVATTLRVLGIPALQVCYAAERACPGVACMAQ